LRAGHGVTHLDRRTGANFGAAGGELEGEEQAGVLFREVPRGGRRGDPSQENHHGGRMRPSADATLG
jgi:hypothetical protein